MATLFVIRKYTTHSQGHVFRDVTHCKNTNQSWWVLNKITLTIEESIHVIFYESNPKSIEVEIIDCASIMEKMSLEYKEKNEDHEINQDKEKKVK